MAETIITNGIVLRESATGERDRLVTILTEKIGVVRAFANGAKGAKSKSASATDLLCFSKFTLYRSNSNVFTVREASVIEIFFPIRQDLIKLSLAQYIAEIAADFSPREAEAGEQLSLVLNSLSFIANEKRPILLVKASVELRLLTLSGYMPALVACDGCGEYEKETMFFDVDGGKLFCSDCVNEKKKGVFPVTLGVLSAMRHICFSESKKVFGFSLPENSLKSLNVLTERYLLSIAGRRFKTLDFFNEMTL